MLVLLYQRKKDVKNMGNHEMMIFHAIEKYHHATMMELVRESELSASVIKQILEDMEAQGYIEKTMMNTATKGRNAFVYSLSKKQFMVLGVFVDEQTVDISIRDALNHTHYENHLYLKETKELEDFIVQLTKQFHVTCISMAAAGIVEDLYFYRDVNGKLIAYGICEHLSERLSIPIIIQNDVKTMMMGYVAKSKFKNLAYVYFSRTGVGSSYCIDGKILQGIHHFSGELGLIPFHGRKINDLIKEGPRDALIKDILIQIITTISTTIDPDQIVISGKNIPFHLEKEIKEACMEYLSERYPLCITFRNVPLQDVMDGVHYLGIQRLFEEYTKQGEKA